MKIGMKCRVDSTTEIGKEPIQVTVDGTDFILVPSEDGLLKELTVIVGIDVNNSFKDTAGEPFQTDLQGRAMDICRADAR